MVPGGSQSLVATVGGGSQQVSSRKRSPCMNETGRVTPLAPYMVGQQSEVPGQSSFPFASVKPPGAPMSLTPRARGPSLATRAPTFGDLAL